MELQIQQSLSGYDINLDPGNTLFALGLAYFKHDSLEMSLLCYKEYLKLRNTSFDNRIHVAQTLNLLGVVYYRLSDFNASLDNFTVAVDIFEKELGLDHNDTSLALHYAVSNYFMVFQIERSPKSDFLFFIFLIKEFNTSGGLNIIDDL